MKYPFSVKNLAFYPCVVLLALFGNQLATLAEPLPIITNQATGDYQDPVDPTKTLNTTSNILQVIMQEVAGIAVTATSITRQDGTLNGIAIGNAEPNDILYYNFTVQNIGNDTTRFFVPNVAQVNSLGSFQKVQYFDGTAWIDVPDSGYTSPPVNIGDRLLARVVVKALSGGGNLSVTLGKTANATQTQNQQRVDDSADVYTVDASDNTVGEYNGVPGNGVREAQATQSIRVNSLPTALATVKLSIAEPFNPTDNTIGFGLSLSVLNTLPPNFSNIVLTDLTGYNISIDGQSKNGILIADAIPLGTQFASATAPSKDWIPVYYYSTTPIGPNERADRLSWSATPPDANSIVNVRRAGFFRPDYRMLKGTEIAGFQVKVTVTDFNQDKIYNIAQVFGTNPADPNSPSSPIPSQSLIYDESGDNLPNNYNSDGTPPILSSTQQIIVSPGIVDPNVPESDPRSPIFIGQDLGSNSLNSPFGEFLQVSLKAGFSPSLKNGPREQPQAVGPTDDNDDFTNKSTALANVSDSTFNPALLPFTNTVMNTSSLARDIKVVPKVQQASDLPNGTQVTLLDPVDPQVTATYNYQDGIFTPIASSPVFLLLKQVSAGASKNYTVFIDLPAGTPKVKAFPVQLLAFIDSNNNNQPDTNEAQNITIDRAYTGFMQVVKESRVLDIDRQPINNGQGDGAFSESAKPVLLGQYIEYRITYSNISTPAPSAGNGNKTIGATNFVIIEDGRVFPNNWADLTDHDPNSAVSSSGDIVYSTTSATSDATNPSVIRYENKVTEPIGPGQTGTFTFRRRVR